jgi:hypothetical protein
VGTERVLVTGRDTPREDTLALILRQLIVRIWDLNPVSRGEQVEVNDILASGLVIEMIEDGLIVPYVMEGGEFGSVQKPPAANAINGKEITELRIAETDAHAPSRGAERPVRSIHITEDPTNSETGSGCYLCDEARLVAKFGVWRTGNDFHALDRADGNLRGIDFALLVADGLSIDNEARLKVITQRMVQAVGVGCHAPRAVRDRLAEPSGGIDGRDFHNGASVNVDVR